MSIVFMENGKQCIVTFSIVICYTKGTVDYIHSNHWGPSLIISKSRAQYLLIFIDDYCGKVWVYFLKRKGDVFATFKQWKALIKKQTSKKIKRLELLMVGNYAQVSLMSSTWIKKLLDIALSRIHYNKIGLQNIWTRHSWNEHIVCFYKLDCQRTFRRKQITCLVIWLIDPHRQF